MIRVISAVVSVSVVLAFVAIDQYLNSNQPAQLPASIPDKAIIETPRLVPVPVDNDQRGAHSYFVPPRLFSNRYHTTSQSTTNGALSRNLDTSPNLSSASEAAVIPLQEQDLLRSGYLKDNESNYKPSFGHSR